MGLKNTITLDNENVKTLFNIFPTLTLKRKFRLKKESPESSVNTSYEGTPTRFSISKSRRSLSSSSSSRTRRRLSSGTHSMRKVNRSQAKRISSGNIISSLQALKSVNGNYSPFEINSVSGTEKKLDNYVISATSLIEDEMSPDKIDITLENSANMENLTDLEASSNDKSLHQIDKIRNQTHH